LKKAYIIHISMSINYKKLINIIAVFRLTES